MVYMNDGVLCSDKVRIMPKGSLYHFGILDARALYPDASLADLYDETTMPPELRRAHKQNDKAVMQAYGFSVKDMTEPKCVAELMKLYQMLTLC